MSTQARLRAEIDIRAEASINAEIIERFPTNSLVEILEDQGDFLKVKAIRLKKTPSGFLPRSSLIFSVESKKQTFPNIILDDGTRSPSSVPSDLPVTDFLHWLGTNNRPHWISEDDWNQLDAPSQTNLITAILTEVSNHQSQWDAWVNTLNANDRQEEAVMNEWLVISEGGREVFTIRDQYIYQQPSEMSPHLGTALKGQVLRWTGGVAKSEQNQKTRNFYEVEFYRMSKSIKGWFRSDLTAEFVYPTLQNDPDIEENSQNAFDLTKPILRHPQDPEIAAAKDAHLAAQYIDIRRAKGTSMRHFCLCGEFCVAALVGSDMIPLLTKWRDSGSTRAQQVLKNNKELTSISDLISILKIFNYPVKIYNSVPVTLKFIKDELVNGAFAISGCGINSGGKVKADGTIRHWVIVEDVLPVGNSGWVRIYNPFHNREEVYEFNNFMTSAGNGLGAWVEEAKP